MSATHSHLEIKGNFPLDQAVIAGKTSICQDCEMLTGLMLLLKHCQKVVECFKQIALEPQHGLLLLV